ncbi:MAG: twin-arginine translocase TatA/TatE family subunit [Chloroflexi bacterium]|nr:twin-arginine translocase TatA/TatE family subunit [Chloroflexota bacterium]
MQKIGPWELVIVLVIAILVFGVGKLGQLGRDLGHGIREFRQALQDGNSEESESSSTT